MNPDKWNCKTGGVFYADHPVACPHCGVENDSDRWDAVHSKESELEEDNKPRRFKLVRIEDASGVSGTGVIAYGVQYNCGKCTLCWDGEDNDADYISVGVYDSIEELESIHGHGGATRVVWIDDPNLTEKRMGEAIDNRVEDTEDMLDPEDV